MKNNKAFTLIELLVVIAVIGLLSSVVLVSLNGIKESGRDAKRQEDLKNIALAMEVYNGTEGEYPATEGGANAVPSIGTYLSQIPTDPIDSGDLQYTWTESDGSYYCLYSKLEGTEDTYYCASSLGSGRKSGSGYVPSSADCCGINLTGEFICGSELTFIYNGEEVTYGTVESLGECWMDRNLGALQVATAYNDSLAYGDLFQWGREDDGHQVRTSGQVEGNMSLLDQPGHSNFITEGSSPYDWADNSWTSRWTVTSSDPCPIGWRVPMEAELSAEESSWAQQNYNGAYTSPLKLTAAGFRYYSPGDLYLVGSYGYYWSSAVDGNDSRSLRFYDSGSIMYSGCRSYGFSVRCLKD